MSLNMETNCKWLLNKKGFTLIEMLWSLLVIALIAQAMIVSIQTYYKIDTRVRDDYTVNWYQFLVLFERELSNYTITDVTDQELFIEDVVQQPYKVIHKQGKIYKSVGYQPFLYEVESWHLAYDAPFLQIELVFINGQTFQGVIEVETNQ